MQPEPEAALKNAVPAPGSDQKKIGSGSGTALKVAAPGGSGSATLPTIEKKFVHVADHLRRQVKYFFLI